MRLSLIFICVGLLIFVGSRIYLAREMVNWYGVEPYRLLVLKGNQGTEPNSVELVTLWPDTHKMVTLIIPPDLKINAMGGYGNYRIAALVDLGRVEKIGDKLIGDSLGFAFGMPIHQVLWQTSASLDLNRARIDVFKKTVAGKQSLAESIAVLKLLGEVNPKDTEFVDLAKGNVTAQVVEPDGTSSRIPEAALLDHLLLEKFAAIWADAATTQIAIVNAAGKAQLATQWSKFPRIGGFDVISVTDRPEISDETTILFSSETLKQSMVGLVLKGMLPRFKIKVANTDEYRAPVVIMLGLDSWKWQNVREAYLAP